MQQEVGNDEGPDLMPGGGAEITLIRIFFYCHYCLSTGSSGSGWEREETEGEGGRTIRGTFAPLKSVLNFKVNLILAL